MDKNFIDEMNIENAVKLDKPYVVLLSGLPGSGKSFLAKQLSKRLKIFLLSSDYIRNYYYQFTDDYSEEKRREIEEKVLKINEQRLIKLIENKVPFVFDKDFNKEKSINKFILDYHINDYFEIIKIKVNSSDEHNIERIQHRKMDYKKIDSDIIGDNTSYHSSYSKEVYYEIKERKPQELANNYFDYVIDNNTTIEEFEKQIVSLINDIKKKYHKKH